MWEHLWLAHWCREKSEKYFEEQGFHNNTIAEQSTKAAPFDLYSASREMSAIREQLHGLNDSAFFTLNRFKNYLQAIMGHILFIQNDLSHESTPSLPQSNKPYALKLRLNYNQLQLIVEWSQDGEISCHLLHKFNENSARLANLQPIFANGSTKTISLSENSSGYNAVKYLERIGLKGELVKVFVEKSSTEEITFYGIRVELNRPKFINQPELLKQIQELRFIAGSLSQLR